MIPNWFKMGSEVSYMGGLRAIEVISISEKNNTWIGKNRDGEEREYPLDKVQKYWKLSYLEWYPE